MFSYSMSDATLTAIQKQFKEYGPIARSKQKARPYKRFLKTEDIRQVLTFITNYAEDHAVILPGRHPNQKNFVGKLLPSHVTKASVWREYQRAMVASGRLRTVYPLHHGVRIDKLF